MTTERDRQTWNVKGLRTRYKPKSRLGHGMVSMAPWLDFLMLLILFGLINSTLVLQPGVVVSLPQARFNQGTKAGLVAVILAVNSGGTGRAEAIVFFDDERFMVADPAQMDGFAQALSRELKEHPGAPLVLQADKDIAQGTIVDVIEVASHVGVETVNVAVRPR